ncbi:MAG: RidA family protein [Rhodobacteraceae bacterium]|nr:RidA family protein [Paracoccaceae bacterium]
MKALTPTHGAVTFGAYSPGIEHHGGRIVLTSGQLALAADGTVPSSVAEQTNICLQAIEAILREAGMDRSHILRLNAYVTDRRHMAEYMAARDAFLSNVEPKPASTLMIVSGFTRPEFLVEIEAHAGET